MKVRCIAEYPSLQQVEQLGEGFYPKQAFHITVGKEYTVYGIQLVVRSNLYGTGTLIEVVSDYEHFNSAPLILFEIIDPRVSRFWECRMWDSGNVTLWPPSFYREYYHDDLSEGVFEVVEDFKRVRALLESEFTGISTM